CLSKGLTGGYLPLSAVMTTEAVYAAFYDEYVKLNAFLHSHSFTGNPLGCAAARASLAIFRDDHVLEANRTLAARLGERAGALADHPHVAEVRQRGMILAIELAADKASRARRQRRAPPHAGAAAAGRAGAHSIQWRRRRVRGHHRGHARREG